jgi:mono/diheme cytochrome c family protein
VAEAADGTLFVSDDYAGAIYRVTRADGAARAPAAVPARVAAADPLAGLAPAEREGADRRGAAHWDSLDCAACHDAARAAPGVVPVVLGSLAQRYDVADLTSFLSTPTPPMPAVPLDESGRRDLAIHLLQRFP